MMVQKILKIITNNFGLKVLAAVIAIVFWLIIVEVEDPEKTRTFTVQAEMVNPEFLAEQGLTYEILDESDIISFTVTGQRSIVTRMTIADFRVTADLSQMENNSQVPIAVSATRYGDLITISKRAKYVEVSVEKIVEKRIAVEVDTIGEAADGFLVSELQANVQEIVVTGPQSVVEQIDRAVAWVEISAMQADSAVRADLVLYDANNEAINTSRLQLDHNMIYVSIGILEQKEIPVTYEYQGTPAAGYQVAGIAGSVTRLVVQGESELLTEVERLVITGELLDVTGATANVEETVLLAGFLPEGIGLAADQPKEARVTITLEAEELRSYQVPVGNIEIQNVAEGYEAEAMQTVVEVSFRGYPSQLGDITEQGIRGTVNASGLTEGQHILPVKIAGDLTPDSTVQMEISILKQVQDVPTADPEDNGSGAGENTPE